MSGDGTRGAGVISPRLTVIAPYATGNPDVDTPNLLASVARTPQGGRLFLYNGHYKIDEPLPATLSITIEGESIAATYKPGSEGGSSSIPRTPFLAGTIIEQTVAATNIIDATTSAISLNLSRLGLMFTAGLASTGTAVNARPTLATGGGFDFGVTDYHWEDVYVHGHDGNHYAFNLLNTQYGLLENLRSYGGGGIAIEADLGTINSGNLVIVSPFFNVFNAGTAHAIHHSAAVTSGHPGQLNLIEYLRPQCSISGAAFTQATQLAYNDAGGAGSPVYITLIDPDFEGMTATNRPSIGPGTQVLGNPYMDGGVVRFANGVALGKNAAGNTANTVGQFAAMGYQALAAQTSGSKNAAFGYMALSAITTNSDSAAFGNQALKFNTGQQNVAVGSDALLGVTGTSTGSLNNAIGYQALAALTTGGSNVANGQSALNLLTTGNNNIGMGRDAGKFTNGSTANAIVAGNDNTFVGYASGSYAGDISSATTLGYQALAAVNGLALGKGAQAGASGAVAIGRDSSGGAATTTTSNAIVLGTANHKVQIKNNATGAGTPLFGTNSPAVTNTNPYTWLVMLSSDGSTVYVPAWK